MIPDASQPEPAFAEPVSVQAGETYDYSSSATKPSIKASTYANTSTFPETDQLKVLRQKALVFIEMNGGNYLLLLLASLVLLVEAIRDVRVYNEKKFSNKGYAYAVFAGLFSVLVSGFNVITRNRQPLDLRVRLFLVIANTVVWTIALLWLTFDHWYNVTGNGFFSIWVGFLLSCQILSAETALLTGVINQLKAFGWQLGLLLLCAVIIIIACAAECNGTCNGEELFGIIVGCFTVLFSVLVFHVIDRISQPVRVGLFGFITISWISVAFLLTFVNPFRTTGNGYFASWGGLFAATILLSKILNLGEGNVLHSAENANVV